MKFEVYLAQTCNIHFGLYPDMAFCNDCLKEATIVLEGQNEREVLDEAEELVRKDKVTWITRSWKKGHTNYQGWFYSEGNPL